MARSKAGRTDNRDSVLMAHCNDCDLPYSKFGIDCTLPNNQWELITTFPAILLCATCIARRAKNVNGAIAIRMVIDIMPERREYAKGS
jgi:hypothetical protein